MSYDLILMKIPPTVSNLKELNDLGDRRPPIGDKYEVIDTIREILPRFRQEHEEVGVLEASEYSMRFDMGADNPVTEINLSIRGSDRAFEPLCELMDQTGWMALDPAAGEFIELDRNPEQRLSQWQRFRDRHPSGWDRHPGGTHHFPGGAEAT